ncbi:MAG: GTP-binding protein [Candidatus Lokiarchaeota archaeon]|nr:GTP-binding protein [Candidatus Lokiarchaeota archaeon]
MSANNEKIVFQPKTEHIYKVIVIGDPSIGKTSLLKRFTSNKFTEKYYSTVGVQIVKEQLEIKDPMGNEVIVNLMFWDIAGQPQFYMLHRPYFNGADGMILVFDVTRSSTFSNVKNWYNTAVKYGLSGIPRILVGNKIDLTDERKIIVPMMQHLSEELNATYYETSAKTGENVKLIFKNIADIVLQSKMKKQ